MTDITTQGKQRQNHDEFAELTRPMIKWLCENHHPHAQITITSTRAELLEGVQAFVTNDYVKD